MLNEAWGIDAVLQPLPGEFDLNFLATARDGPRCVLKVVREGCDAAFVSLLCAAHAHVRSRDATVTVPAVVPTTADDVGAGKVKNAEQQAIAGQQVPPCVRTDSKARDARGHSMPPNSMANCAIEIVARSPMNRTNPMA